MTVLNSVTSPGFIHKLCIKCHIALRTATINFDAVKAKFVQVFHIPFVVCHDLGRNADGAKKGYMLVVTNAFFALFFLINATHECWHSHQQLTSVRSPHLHPLRYQPALSPRS